MPNLTQYAIQRQNRKVFLKKILRIRSSSASSAAEYFYSLSATWDYDDSPPEYYCFAYDLGDGQHIKNFNKVIEDFGVSLKDLQSIFPELEEFQDGYYLYWRSLVQARFDMDKLYELILTRSLF